MDWPGHRHWRHAGPAGPGVGQETAGPHRGQHPP